MSAEPLTSLDRSTLRERALEALRSAITSGRYRPGDHLGEVDLATHLGVSRGTVREALRHLQQEGLVTAGNRGMLRVNDDLAHRGAGAVPGASSAGEPGRHRDHPLGRPRPGCGGAPRGAVAPREHRGRLRGQSRGRPGLSPAPVPLSGNSMLVEAWRYLEGRVRVTIMNYESDEKPTMMSRDRHLPIVEAIESGDVERRCRCARAAHGVRGRAVRPSRTSGVIAPACSGQSNRSRSRRSGPPAARGQRARTARWSAAMAM